MRVVLTLSLLILWPQPAQKAPPDLTQFFNGLNGTFVLLNGATGEYIRHDPKRAAERFAPCSTFKIAHTAILLESGVAPDENYTVAYEPRLKQPTQWAHDFDLKGAFKASALWYYQALARRLGMAEEQRFVTQFMYGNADTSGGLESAAGPFWVDGSLRVSANEQVDFLERFYKKRLGLSARTDTLTKSIMLADSGSSWRLSSKTGACKPPGEEASIWYVGYVERGLDVHYFALQMGDPDSDRAFAERIPITRKILASLGILD
jgi:beta-lactamase class D